MAGALLPTSIRANALQGAALGAIQPVTNGGERAINSLVGLGAGAGGAALPRAITGAASGARNFLSSVSGRGLPSADRAAGQVILREATNPNMLSITESSVPEFSGHWAKLLLILG